jgi:hypothetical protein
MSTGLDHFALVILAFFGFVMLLLTQIDEVLARLPPIIRAFREVCREVRGESGGRLSPRPPRRRPARRGR